MPDVRIHPVPMLIERRRLAPDVRWEHKLCPSNVCRNCESYSPDSR